MKILKKNKLADRKAKVFVQSFETAGLRQLNRQIDVPLVALLGAKDEKPADRPGTTYGKLMTPSGLKGLARFVDGIGPSKDSIIPLDASGRSAKPTTLVRDAHKAGLLVHPYTFRRENVFLPRRAALVGRPERPGPADRRDRQVPEARRGRLLHRQPRPGPQGDPGRALTRRSTTT